MTDNRRWGKTVRWGYDQHDRSVLDVVDHEEWAKQEEWAITESLAYASLVTDPKNVTGARHLAGRSFVDVFEAMLNDLLHEPLNICTATDTVQESDQQTFGEWSA